MAVADDLSYKAQFIPPKGAAADLLGWADENPAQKNDFQPLIIDHFYSGRMKWTPKIGQVDKLRIASDIKRNAEAINHVKETRNSHA